MSEIFTLDQTPLVIRLHLVAALLALPLGAVVLFRRKGNLIHRWLGRFWVWLMLTVAIGSFWIQGRGHLSAIHVLSVVTIVNLGYAFWAIRRGKVHGHRISMICSYTALCIAGVFTLLPYRMLGKLVFG